MADTKTQAVEDVNDWLVDFGQRGLLLLDETIGTLEVTTPSDLTQPIPASIVSNGKAARIWLTGGNPGVKYAVSVKITTNQGRSYTRVWYILIKDQVIG